MGDFTLKNGKFDGKSGIKSGGNSKGNGAAFGLILRPKNAILTNYYQLLPIIAVLVACRTIYAVFLVVFAYCDSKKYDTVLYNAFLWIISLVLWVIYGVKNGLSTHNSYKIRI